MSKTYLKRQKLVQNKTNVVIFEKIPKGPFCVINFEFFYETFFWEIFLLHQRVPSFFKYLATKWMLENPKGSPFTCFGTVRLFEVKFSFFAFFEKFSKPPEGPVPIFLIFSNWKYVTKSQMDPLFSVPGAMTSGRPARQIGRLGFSKVFRNFVLSFS